MWQLGIIIEISSRKELLDPIWSLPEDSSSIIPFSVLPHALSRLVVRVLEMAFFAVISTALQTYSYDWCRFSLQHGVFISHAVERRFLAEMGKIYLAIGLSVRMCARMSRTLISQVCLSKKRKNLQMKILFYISPLWFLSPLFYLSNFS